MFKHATIIAGAILMTLATTHSASAQTPANRRVMAVSVQDPAGGPAGGGPTTKIVRAHVTAEASPTAGAVDLSMRVQFRLNGTTVAEQTINAEANLAGPSSPCGDFPCELGEVCYCHGSPPDCECGYWIGIAEQGIPCSAGDEIMVILYPAPGAAPEADPSDDMKLTRYQGEDIFWDRGILRLDVRPTVSQGGPAGSGGDNLFDVFVEMELAARYDGPLELPLGLFLLVNGQPAGDTNFPNIPDTITY
jgi:hypothetical protein